MTHGKLERHRRRGRGGRERHGPWRDPDPQRPPTGPEWDQTPGADQRIPVNLLGDTIALGLVNGSAIQAGDRREMMAAEGTTPTPADRLQIGAVTFSIVRAEPYAPGGVALFFDLILRA
ncbi:MAG: hypothetical protein Q4615_10545 [Paracoccus aminovorans]|nr:hypothetical protein [Paracoccus aminovorans]